MASSTLKLDLHSVYYPNVKMDRQIELLSQRFDTFVADEKIEISKYDFINIDIQGAELYALKGFGSLLSDFKYIYTEVNIGHLYESCPLLDEMDEFLTVDLHLVQYQDKVEYFKTVLYQLEQIIRSINSRGWDIKNAIEWQKFTNGMM